MADAVATETRVVSVAREREGVAPIHPGRPPVNSDDREFVDALNAAAEGLAAFADKRPARWSGR